MGKMSKGERSEQLAGGGHSKMVRRKMPSEPVQSKHSICEQLAW